MTSSTHCVLARYTVMNAGDAGKLTDRDVAFKRPWYIAINNRNDVIISDEKAAQAGLPLVRNGTACFLRRLL